jgi:hypothetical protein
MIAFKNKYIIFLSLFIGLFLSGCKDKWDDHNKIQDPIIAVNLLTQIKLNPDLTKFADLLNKTGYDLVVASSKTFTIWAPTNAAITAMDQTILADTAKLKLFVANHITNQSYLTSAPNPSLTIRTLNGKNIVFTKTTFEEANIVVANRFVGNGVLHTIDKAIIPKLNAWDYLTSSATSMQKTFLTSLSYSYVDTTLATVTSIDPKTGLPILKPGTGVVNVNYFLQRAATINNEDQKYTFVILTDAAYATEKSKISKYFVVNNPLNSSARNTFMSDSLTNWNIVKDLAFVGDYSANLPDTLTSIDSTRVHLDKSAIVETHKVSNGVVYVMSRVDYKMASKIKPIIIQAENNVSSPTGAVPYWNSDMGSGATSSFVRTTITRRNPFTNVDFREIYYYTSGKASYWIHYFPTLYSAAYNVYWVAVRDFNTTAVAPAVPLMFSQAVTFGTTTILATLPYKQVDILNYNETLVGTYTAPAWGKTDAFLVGAANTTTGANSIVCDYIKLVPVTN